MNQHYLHIWIAFATDCLGYHYEEAVDLFVEHDGNLKNFLSVDEIERMFEWSALPVPNELCV